MNKKIIFFISLFSLSLLLFVPVQALILSTQNDIVRIELISKDQSFSLRWTHSVEKEDWEEFFLVKENTIFIESTRFKTFGAGVPNDAGEQTFIKDGWVYMTDIHQPIGPVLHFLTGKETNHCFQTKGSYQPLKPQESYEIRVDSVPLYKYLYLLVKTK